MKETKEVKSIETSYKGYRFRSRLEARFAVFCNECGLEFVYEPEGYEVNGVKYLPDFYLPTLDTHVEVKGKREGYELEVMKTQQFIQWGGPIKTIVFVSEIPDPTEWGLPHFPAYFWHTRGVAPGWFFFYQDEDVVKGHISSANYKGPLITRWTPPEYFSITPKSDYLLRKEASPDTYTFPEAELAWQDWITIQNQKVFSAYKAARSARFEHGENG